MKQYFLYSLIGLIIYTGSIFSQPLKGDSLKVDSLSLKRNTANGDSEIGYKPQMPNVIFPSPASQNFMKYGNHHPNLSTGTVSVDIPLYNIQVNKFSLPISLKYATNGIKVNDSPYPVGFGWALRSGLRITRIIKGKPEECIGGREIKTLPQITYLSNKDKFLYKNAIATSTGITSKDGEYDIFSVSLPNEDFKFFLEKEGTVWKAVTVGTNSKVTIKTQNIGLHFGGDFYFEVIDENGIKYIYGQVDANNPNPYETVTTSYPDLMGITTWGITKITLPGNQGTIDFKWSQINNPTLIIDRGNGAIETLTDLHDCISPGHEIGVPPSSPTPETGLSASRSTYNSIIQLDKIDFSTGIVNYSYVNIPEIGSLLNKIEIKEKVSNTVIKTVQFTRDNNRDGVLLRKLDVSGEGFYTFDYNPIRFDAQKERGQDYWGFYNNQINFGSLAPKVDVLGYYSYDNGLQPVKTLYVTMGSAERKVEDTYIQAYLLTKINYPTGGSTSFEYETHRFDGRKIEAKGIAGAYLEPFTKGGGVRLSKMTNKASDTSPLEIKTYKYGQNENGKGFAVAEPTINTFLTENVGYHEYRDTPSGDVFPRVFNQSYRILTLSEYSNYNDFLLFDVPIWYDEIAEYNNDIKTVYRYSYPTATSDNMMNHFYVSYFNSVQLENIKTCSPAKLNTVGSPFLREKIMYRNNNGIHKPILKEEHEYHMESVSLHSTGVYQFFFHSFAWSDDTHFEWNDQLNCISYSTAGGNIPFCDPYQFGHYEVQLAKMYPVKETSVQYTENDSITQVSEYKYTDLNNNNILEQKTTTNSNQGQLINTYLYPWGDLSGLNTLQKGYVQNMIAQNRVATPIQMMQFNNNTLSGKKIIQYKDYGNNLILPEVEYFSTKNDNGEPRINYHNYDSHGNPLLVSKDDAENVVYLWGYNYQYPIAEIKNATYIQVVLAISGGEATLNSLAASSTPNMGILNALRSSLPSSMVTTYTYKPLIGMESMTDPSGVVTRYEYDTFWRLKTIKDHNQKVVESYEYNYQNQ